MKTIFLLSLLGVTLINSYAQKRPYFVLAYAQKNINLVCGTRVMINNAEVQLTAEEAKTYKATYQAQLAKQYNDQNGYKNLWVELFYPGTVVIYYEGERTYEQRRDGWECTSTWYGFVKANDHLSADNQLAKLQAENRKVIYDNMRRWGSPRMESDKTDDLEVRWVQTKTKVVALITNTRKDAALKVTVKSFKNMGGSISVEEGFQKAKPVETFTMILQPGDRWSQNLENADGFEIDTAPAKTIKEQQGIIDNIKQRIRLYITDPASNKIKGCCGGVRG